MSATYYWYINDGQLKFVDSYDDAATLTPITVRYRERLANKILYSDDIMFSRERVGTSVAIADAKVGMTPLAPILLSPADASSGIPYSPVGNTVATLKWEPRPSGAVPTYYEVYVGLDEDIFNSYSFLYETEFEYVTLSNVALPDYSYIDISTILAASEQVYWCVVPYNMYGEGAASDVYTFTFAPTQTGTVAPNAPTLASPVDSSTNLPTTLTLTANTNGGTKPDSFEFRIRKDTDPIADAIIVFTETVDGLGVSGVCEASGLSYSTEYAWTARGINNAGPGAWATEITFTTAAQPSGLLWEEQSDGLDEDLQLAALYLALSRAADLAGGDDKTSRYFYDKFTRMQKDLRRKYNSAKYKNITIKPYSF